MVREGMERHCRDLRQPGGCPENDTSQFILLVKGKTEKLPLPYYFLTSVLIYNH